MTSGADLLRVEGLRITFSVLGGEVEAVRGSEFQNSARKGDGARRGVRVRQVGHQPGDHGHPAEWQASAAGVVQRSRSEAKGVDLLSPGYGRARYPGDPRRTHQQDLQEPMTSLSPLHTIGNQISEVLKIHTDTTRQAPREDGGTARLCRLSDPKRPTTCIPSNFPRHATARDDRDGADLPTALLIADEPTTALDVTVQAQYCSFCASFKASSNMAMLLITHDLGVVAQHGRRGWSLSTTARSSRQDLWMRSSVIPGIPISRV